MSRQKEQLAAIQCSLECLAILIYKTHHWAILYLQERSNVLAKGLILVVMGISTANGIMTYWLFGGGGDVS
jgi:hypothetical protein